MLARGINGGLLSGASQQVLLFHRSFKKEILSGESSLGSLISEVHWICTLVLVEWASSQYWPFYPRVWEVFPSSSLWAYFKCSVSPRFFWGQASSYLICPLIGNGFKLSAQHCKAPKKNCTDLAFEREVARSKSHCLVFCISSFCLWSFFQHVSQRCLSLMLSPLCSDVKGDKTFQSWDLVRSN